MTNKETLLNLLNEADRHAELLQIQCGDTRKSKLAMVAYDNLRDFRDKLAKEIQRIEEEK